MPMHSPPRRDWGRLHFRAGLSPSDRAARAAASGLPVERQMVKRSVSLRDVAGPGPGSFDLSDTFIVVGIVALAALVPAAMLSRSERRARLWLSRGTSVERVTSSNRRHRKDRITRPCARQPLPAMDAVGDAAQEADRSPLSRRRDARAGGAWPGAGVRRAGGQCERQRRLLDETTNATCIAPGCSVSCSRRAGRRPEPDRPCSMSAPRSPRYAHRRHGTSAIFSSHHWLLGYFWSPRSRRNLGARPTR